MQAVLVERAQSLLTQAADVTAERLAMVRAQSERTGKTMEEVKRVVGLAESALEEKDAVTVMALKCAPPRAHRGSQMNATPEAGRVEMCLRGIKRGSRE